MLTSATSSLALLVGSVFGFPAEIALVDRAFVIERQYNNGSQIINANQNITAPIADGGVLWTSAHQKVSGLVQQMTLEEKVSIITGQIGRCAGNTGAVERLGVPALCLQDGPAGVRPTYGVTQWAAETTLGATWDVDLIYQSALAMGKEFRAQGVNVALAPVSGGPYGRSPLDGRSYENFAADPYASGISGYHAIRGILDAGVLPTVKHYLAYEQETYRNLYGVTASYSVFPASQQLPISSNMDDKATHELYLWTFADAVRAGAPYVMCSYNEVNRTHSCHNQFTNNGLLKTELNFQGGVMSDWGGTWATKEAIVGGLDIEMPGFGYGGALGTFFGPELVSLVNNGSVAESRVNDAVTRLLTPYYASNQPENPLPSVPFDAVGAAGNTTYRNVQQPSSLALLQQIGEDAAVLLKNNGGLPLKAPKRIAILGSDAGPGVHSQDACGAFGDACPYKSDNGTVTLGAGSGFAFPHNVITPLAAIARRAQQDGSTVRYSLNDTDLAYAKQLAAESDVVLVFANFYTQEGQDRLDLKLNAESLIVAAAEASNNVVVILHIPSTADLEAFADSANVTAILAPLLPGEQSGNSLVPVLYGDVSPSGKMPFTIGKRLEDYIPNSIVTDPVYAPQSDFTEGVNIDYRWFDSKNITPRYEFGYGLSYSTFEMSNIKLDQTYKADTSAYQKTAEPYEDYEEGNSLYDIIATVTVNVKNTGDVVACEVAQLYVQYPAEENEPPRQLRSYSKVKRLSPGASETVSLPLRRKDLSVWDVVRQLWRVSDGEYVFHVGNSSRSLPLTISWKK